MNGNPGATLATLSDGAISEAWRLIGCSPEPEEPPPKPRRPRRMLVILDGSKIRVRLRRLGLSAADLADRLRIWRLEELVDYGELAPKQAEKLARALGMPLDEITYGVRKP